MNPSSKNTPPIEPLDAEERELAALLGRIGPHGEPSPSLDAKILAAAHAAVVRGPARVSPRRRRWPAVAGLAASVLFAAGIAWQLRPQHEVMQASEAPVSVRLIGDASAPAAADAAVPAVKSVAPPEVSEPAPAPMKAMAPPKVKPSPSPAEPARERRYEAPPVDVAEPRPTDIVVSPPPPPAPPAPAPEPASSEPVVLLAPGTVQAQRAFTPAAPAPATARKEAYVAETAAAPVPMADTGANAKATANDSTTLDSVVVSGSRIDETDVLGIEVEADTRLSKRAWLHRIELRRAQGDTDGARESLRLFVKKYPRATIPSDLRGLLQE